MPHVVSLPISPTQYESEYWTLYRDIKKKELLAWCENQGLQDGVDYQYLFIKCFHDGDHAHVMDFNKVGDALLFKLTWGGQQVVHT